MLVDAGWPGFEDRDLHRILRTAERAGIRKIDQMLTTHYHLDHVGGVPPLAEKFPIVSFVDHGDNTETGPNAQKLSDAYYRVRAKGKHLVVKPGDHIPLAGVEVDVVSARGAVIDRPLAGAGAPNPLCASTPKKAVDASENGKSVGFVLRYGKFRFVDLADLTWNIELELACPQNKLGPADLYLTSHHGLSQSGPPALVHALAPRVAVMNNGAKKGGSPEAWHVVQESPRMEGFWQLHYAVSAGEANAPDHRIANLTENGNGHGILVTARRDGSFTVANERTGYREEYPARGR